MSFKPLPYVFAKQCTLPFQRCGTKKLPEEYHVALFTIYALLRGKFSLCDALLCQKVNKLKTVGATSKKHVPV